MVAIFIKYSRFENFIILFDLLPFLNDVKFSFRTDGQTNNFLTNFA